MSTPKEDSICKNQQKWNAFVNADHFCQFVIPVHFLSGRNFLGWISRGGKSLGGSSTGGNSAGGSSPCGDWPRGIFGGYFLRPCIKQHECNVWSSIHDKVKQHLFLRASGMAASDKSKYPYSKSILCSGFFCFWFVLTLYLAMS